MDLPQLKVFEKPKSQKASGSLVASGRKWYGLGKRKGRFWKKEKKNGLKAGNDCKVREESNLGGCLVTVEGLIEHEAYSSARITKRFSSACFEI